MFVRTDIKNHTSKHDHRSLPYLIYGMLKLLRLSWEDISSSRPLMIDFALVPPLIYWPRSLCNYGHPSFLTPFGHLSWSKREVPLSLLFIIIHVKFLNSYRGGWKCKETLYILVVPFFCWTTLKYLGSKISIYYDGNQSNWNEQTTVKLGKGCGGVGFYVTPPPYMVCVPNLYIYIYNFIFLSS